MEDFNVEPTAEVIDRAANIAHELYATLKRMADSMRAKQDITYATEALSAILGFQNEVRCDLLVTLPIREFQVREMNAERKGATK